MKKKKWLIGGGATLLTYQLLLNPIVYAQGNWLNHPLARENAEIQSIFSDVIRWLLWKTVMLFYNCCYFFEQTLNYVFMIKPEINSPQYQSLINKSLKLGLLFVTLVIMVIGIKQLLRPGLSLVKQTLINAFIISTVILSLNVPIANGLTLIPLLANMSQNAISYFLDNDSLNLSKQMIMDNLVDVKVAYDTNEMNKLEFYKFNPNYLDYTEQITANDVGGKFPVYDQNNGTWKLEPIQTGVFGWFDTDVYRWKLQDPFLLILQFATMTLGFIFAGLKFIKLWLELFFKQVIMPFIGLTDLENGQRFKKLITSIGATCLLMVIVAIVFRIYQISNHWISDGFGLNKSNMAINYLKVIGFIATTLFLLDGPKIVEELFGMDAGISGDAVRTGSHMMNIGRNVAGGISAINKGISNTKSFITDPNKGKAVKQQAEKMMAGAKWTGQKMQNGVSEVAHFKGFDENGNVMSSNPKHNLNDSTSAQNRQSLAEMGQQAWSGTKAMVGRVNTKVQDVGFNAKTRLQDSERLQAGVHQAKDFGQNAKQVGQKVVNTHLDQLQPKAQQLQAMSQLQNDKLATEKQQLADKQQLRQYDLSQEIETPKPKTWEEMTRSERFNQKLLQASKEPKAKSSASVPKGHPTSDMTWQESLQHQLIESGNGHLAKDYVKQQKKEELRQRLQQANQKIAQQQTNPNLTNSPKNK